MTATTAPVTGGPSRWSIGRASLVAVAPIVAATISSWMELGETGDTPMWIVAGAFFLVAPGIAGIAADRSPDPTLLRVSIAILLSGALFAIWIVNVPEPTQ